VPNQPVEIRFGSEQTGFLAISIRGRAYKHRKESWDGNWLLVDVSVQLPKFTAQVPGMLRTEELHVLSSELHQFFESLRDTVDFATHESWLVFQISSEASGRVALSGTVTDAAARDSALKFTIRFDQILFAAQAKALHQAVAAFPVIGIT
jgi:hypothetical protein